jgi:hypothetical protein
LILAWRMCASGRHYRKRLHDERGGRIFTDEINLSPTRTGSYIRALSDVSEFEHMICIDGSYEDEDGSFNYYFYLRPWAWTGRT